jgi:hypothetical protein
MPESGIDGHRSSAVHIENARLLSRNSTMLAHEQLRKTTMIWKSYSFKSKVALFVLATAWFATAPVRAENILLDDLTVGPFYPQIRPHLIRGDAEFGGATRVLVRIRVTVRPDRRGVDASLLYRVTEPQPDFTTLNFSTRIPLWDAPQNRTILRLSNEYADLNFSQTVTAPGAGAEFIGCNPGPTTLLESARPSHVVRSVSVIADTGGGDVWGGRHIDHKECDAYVKSITFDHILVYLND